MDGEVHLSLSNLEALKPKAVETATAMFAGGFSTINERREQVGLEEIEDGDEVLIPANYVPIANLEGVLEDEEG